MPSSHILFLCWFSTSARRSTSSQSRSATDLMDLYFIRWTQNVGYLWSWGKLRIFTHTGLANLLPSLGHPLEWRACCQRRAWEALISTLVGCRLIGLIGDLSLEAQHHGQGCPQAGPVGITIPGQGGAGSNHHIGRWQDMAGWVVTKAAPLGKGRNSWRERRWQPSCFGEEKGTEQCGLTEWGWASWEAPGCFF